MGWLIMKYIKKGFSVFLSLFIMCTLVFNVHVYAEETTYQYSDTASSNGITLKVEWNEPALGQETTFHVSASGGSGNYKFRMDSPSYSNPDEWSFESVADPSRGQWMQYTDICASHDFSFTMMASGTYDFRFYLMDTEFGLYYLRCQTYINVFDSNFPSLNTIINDAVAKCKTDSEYQTALNLHDWLLQQLEYDNSLKWSSAESALTRGLGTCQAYESAYSRLLSAAGITNSETRDTYDGHTWNAAYLDGEWYQIDCTWDDSVNNYGDFDSQHVYFGLTDELMAIAHKGHTNIYTDSGYGTRSTSLVDNYFVKNGKAQEWANNYKSEIETNIASKLTSFTITASNASQPESISGIQNGIIAYVINSMDWSTNSTKVTLSCVGESKQFVFTVSYQEKCTNHTWSEGIITTSPTCTEKGVKTFTCTTCGTTKTEEVTALGHDYSTEWTTDVEATCTTEGSKSHHCTRDGCSAKTGYTSIPKTNHEYSSEWIIDKEATCQEEGSKSHHCIHCDEKTDITTISKTDHNWDSGIVTKAATCTTTGVKTYTCKTCKTTKAEEIDALGHDYSTDYTVDVEATCTEAGSKSRHCTHDGCNEKIEETSIPAKGHSWNSGVVTKKATYNQNGTIQYTCKTCGTQKNDSIAKLSNRTESVTYRTHVQDYGWQSWKTNGESSGTSGQSKRLEGIHIKINNKSVNGNIMYRTHVQNIGWQGWKSNGDMSGTSGQSLRLEAIQIKLTDELANSYDIYYRVHAQDYGWLDWAKNGESAGTEGKSKRLEAIQIKLVPKGNSAPGSTSRPFVFDMVSYRTHVQDYGWQSYVSDGTMSGTSGKSKRLEGINIKLSSSIDGGIQYRTHVQDYGWQNWVQNNQMSGTSGKSKRLEAIQIRLTGNIANQYDVYYRVHCQDFGWLGWAKNGESSGSEGYSKRLEGIQVVLVKKGSAAPGNTANHFYKR